jgi:hypothetical protein
VPEIAKLEAKKVSKTKKETQEVKNMQKQRNKANSAIIHNRRYFLLWVRTGDKRYLNLIEKKA